ncbi:MAG: alternative ribosome rescue aminoacyl-tRNA hydrolase ArfB [Oceanihabitans sp.]
MYYQEELLKELEFKAIRSSGAGGQHVNKVATKIELSFNIETSKAFNETQKERLKEQLKNKITKANRILLQCGESRSQHKNKQIVIQRFLQLIKEALIIPKKRKPTKTPKAVKIKRLKNKRVNAEKKANRKKPKFD